MTVDLTAKLNLCTSCGICKGACPRDAISWKRQRGMFFPEIDKAKCVRCGLCSKVCPGLKVEYKEFASELEAVKGNNRYTCNAWSCNSKIRHKSASGGVVTTLIRFLILNGLYDVSFQVKGYDYSCQLKTELVDADALCNDRDFSVFPKSRYLPVSHEDLICYIKNNRTKKVIVVGTPCAIQGIVKVIDQFKLNRDNYFLIGLFCDKVFTYNVYDYFCRHFGEGKKVAGIHFKNKDNGGWPGNMKFIFQDGTSSFQNISERMKVKYYFVPERCHYCIDKLNINADISLGDNYTQIESTKLGSNSVVIRTERALNIWHLFEKQIEQIPIEYDDVLRAQDVTWRLNNLQYARLFEFRKRKEVSIEINTGLKRDLRFFDFERRYDELLAQRCYGDIYDWMPNKLDLKLAKKESSSKVIQYYFRIYYAIRRRIHKLVYIKYKKNNDPLYRRN